MMKEPYNTLTPYKIIDYKGIQYNVCQSYDHISRYSNLRQVTHDGEVSDRFVALETVNPFASNLEVNYHQVTADEENRLDIIAYNTLGDATYGWIIAYFNDIEDGFSVYEGQMLKIPNSVTDLFKSNELLAPINPFSLNLGSE